RDLLYTQAPYAAIDPDWHARWDARMPLDLPAGLGTLALECDAPVALEVRFRRGGERIVLAAARPSQSLKHLLQELGVPPWERPRIPLVFRGENLLAAGDLVRSHEAS